jgi:MFS superfamily sulfate permease-like transporter
MIPFRPRLLDCLQDYRASTFAADLGAGVTVGLVALPLAMAFALPEFHWQTIRHLLSPAITIALLCARIMVSAMRAHQLTAAT